jgi:DNA-directed RNA polymerase subunit M/transcription elongation factor TFIIS
MYYFCPNCTSMKIPKVINYIPPKTVKCQKCGYTNSESKFIRENQDQPSIIPHPH